MSRHTNPCSIPGRSFAAFSLCTLGAALLPATTAAMGANAPVAQSATEQASDPVLGAPLVINGETIPYARVRRQVLYGSAGSVALEMAKLKIFTEEEIQRRIDAGASAADFDIPEAEINDAIQSAEQKVKEEYPDSDIDLGVVLPMGRVGLFERTKLQKLFMKVFLPDVAPDALPGVTLEALKADEQGEGLLTYLQTSWETRQAEGPDAKEDEASRMMIDSVLFQQINDYLTNASNIEMGDQLPDNVLLRVNGREVLVDDVWPDVVHVVSEPDVRSAKQWIAKTTLAKAALKEAGAWLSDEEAAAAYAEHSDPYKDSLFSQERIATVVKKYPSVRIYKEFRRIYDSFKKMIESEMTPEALKAHGDERTRSLVGNGRIDADIILVSAFDFNQNKWKENGWQWAADRTKEVYAALLEEGKDWDAVVEEFSEFYDPPTPASAQGPNGVEKNKGRFRDRARNQIMAMLDESEYWQFLNGSTITDFVFFEQEVGSTAQPVRGPHGYYIPRVLRRTQPDQRVSMDEETFIALVEQDFVLTRLAEWSQDLLAKSKVQGLQ